MYKNAKGRNFIPTIYPLLLNVTSEVDDEPLIHPINAAATVRLHSRCSLLHDGCHGSSHLHFDFEVVP